MCNYVYTLQLVVYYILYEYIGTFIQFVSMVRLVTAYYIRYIYFTHSGYCLVIIARPISCLIWKKLYRNDKTLKTSVYNICLKYSNAK